MAPVAELLGTVWRLAPPIVLIIGVLVAVQRWSRTAGGATDGGLRVLARTGLTRSSVIAIVAVGHRRFLLGASETGVRMLEELEPAHLDQPGTEPTTSRPRTGLVDRMRDRTVRTPVSRSGHALRP